MDRVLEWLCQYKADPLRDDLSDPDDRCRDDIDSSNKSDQPPIIQEWVTAPVMNHSNPPSQQEWRKTLLSPKQFPSQNGVKKEKEASSTFSRRDKQWNDNFFEVALLPGTEADRARASSRITHILPRKGRESTAGTNSTPVTRDQVNTPSTSS